MPLVTFKDVQDECLQFGFNDGPQMYRTRFKNYINEAQAMIARQAEGPEFQMIDTITMVPGTYSYALPAGFARAQDVSYPTLSMRLSPVDIQDYDLSSVTQVFGPPVLYTFYQSNLLLFPNPNTADQLLMRYFMVPATLVNDGDVPVLNANYLQLLVYYSLVKAFEAEDDVEMAQYYQARYDKDFDHYRTDVQFRQADRPVRVGGTWTDRSRPS